MAVKKPPATSPARAELSDGPKKGLVRRATQTMESMAAKGVVGFKGMMDRKKLKLQAVKLRPEPSKRTKWILLLLGLDPSRRIWGLRPFDLKWPGRDSEAWWEQVLAAPAHRPRGPLITRASRRCHRSSSTTKEEHTAITTLVTLRPITRCS